jgi:hypothetical protein
MVAKLTDIKEIDDIYNVLVQKKVTGWADLRNHAAHARWDQHDAEQVAQMLAWVRKFCTDNMPS